MDYSLEIYKTLKKANKKADFSKYEEKIKEQSINTLKSEIFYDEMYIVLEINGLEIEEQVKILTELKKIQDQCKSIMGGNKKIDPKQFLSLYKYKSGRYVLLINSLEDVQLIKEKLKNDKLVDDGIMYYNLPKRKDGNIEYLSLLYYNILVDKEQVKIGRYLTKGDIKNEAETKLSMEMRERYNKIKDLIIHKTTSFYCYSSNDILRIHEKSSKKRVERYKFKVSLIKYLYILIASLIGVFIMSYFLTMKYDIQDSNIYLSIFIVFGLMFLNGLFNYFQIAYDKENTEVLKYPWVCLVVIAFLPLMFKFIDSSLTYSYYEAGAVVITNFILYIVSQESTGINYNYKYHYAFCLFITITSIMSLKFLPLFFIIVFIVLNFIIQIIVSEKVENEY